MISLSVFKPNIIQQWESSEMLTYIFTSTINLLRISNFIFQFQLSISIFNHGFKFSILTGRRKIVPELYRQNVLNAILIILMY